MFMSTAGHYACQQGWHTFDLCDIVTLSFSSLTVLPRPVWLFTTTRSTLVIHSVNEGFFFTASGIDFLGSRGIINIYHSIEFPKKSKSRGVKRYQSINPSSRTKKSFILSWYSYVHVPL
jgi:hypothetical protein